MAPSSLPLLVASLLLALFTFAPSVRTTAVRESSTVLLPMATGNTIPVTQTTLSAQAYLSQDGDHSQNGDQSQNADQSQKASVTWPHNACEKCPSSPFVLRTGYQAFGHWTEKPGAENMLPRAYCPPKSQAALAEEAILSLLAAGYTKTADFLEATGVLMNLKEPATLLAPSDEAFELGNLPVHLYSLLQDWRAEMSLPRNIMQLHLLREFQSYNQLLGAPQPWQKTHLADAKVEIIGFKMAGLGFVKVGAAAHEVLPRALVVKKDMFCNALVIIHGVNHVLLPPVEYLPAGTPAAPSVTKPLAWTARVLAV